MAANSAIEWTMRTWQLTVGCLLRSAGCLNCYAETMAYRLAKMALADIKAGRDPGRKRNYVDAVDLETGKWSGRVVVVPEALDDPRTWRKPQTVFVDSMSDLFFGDELDRRRCAAKAIPFAPVPSEFIARAIAVMADTPRHTYQVLTKRDGRMLDVMREILKGREPPANVWCGCSAENQNEAICRHRSLVDVPAAVRFWSIEPLLGPIDALPLKGIHWVIVGGESGHHARPCNVAWIRDVVGQCKEAGVPCFVKQLGSDPFQKISVGTAGFGLKDRKGGDIDEWPEDLRVRQFPKEQVHA